MNVVAIITARGGSKRIPKKNIKEFCGKPIIAYSIEAALKSKVFDEVMVSTDSKEIADIAKSYGASVPFMRSVETSGDFSNTSDVLNEVLNDYTAQNKNFETFCCLYPTAPFVTAEKLKKAYQTFCDNDADSLMTVVKFSFPPQRAMVIRDGSLEFQFPEYKNSRSQDLEPVYHDCGQFYYCKTESFLKNHFLIGKKTVPFILNETEAQDIDNYSDWILAEEKYRRMYQKGKTDVQTF